MMFDDACTLENGMVVAVKQVGWRCLKVVRQACVNPGESMSTHISEAVARAAAAWLELSARGVKYKKIVCREPLATAPGAIKNDGC